MTGSTINFATNYLAFGGNYSTSGSETFMYTGKPFDATIGLYYYNARDYLASIGRFMTEDTMPGKLIDPLSQNRYIYAEDNPMKYIDPTGHYVNPFLRYDLSYNSPGQSVGTQLEDQYPHANTFGNIGSGLTSDTSGSVGGSQSGQLKFGSWLTDIWIPNHMANIVDDVTNILSVALGFNIPPEAVEVIISGGTLITVAQDLGKGDITGANTALLTSLTANTIYGLILASARGGIFSTFMTAGGLLLDAGEIASGIGAAAKISVVTITTALVLTYTGLEIQSDYQSYVKSFS